MGNGCWYQVVGHRSHFSPDIVLRASAQQGLHLAVGPSAVCFPLFFGPFQSTAKNKWAAYSCGCNKILRALCRSKMFSATGSAAKVHEPLESTTTPAWTFLGVDPLLSLERFLAPQESFWCWNALIVFSYHYRVESMSYWLGKMFPAFFYFRTAWNEQKHDRWSTHVNKMQEFAVCGCLFLLKSP